MKTKTLLLAAAVASIFMTSCAKKVLFNNQIRETLEVANIPLEGIQFYNDKKLVLRRELKMGDAALESGTVKFLKGKTIEFLTLPAQTPGVCRAADKEKLIIAFDRGRREVLEFRNLSNNGKESVYQLYSDGWEVDNAAKILYNGKEYSIQENKRDVKLMIKKDVYDKIKIKKRKMKGVKVRS